LCWLLLPYSTPLPLISNIGSINLTVSRGRLWICGQFVDYCLTVNCPSTGEVSPVKNIPELYKIKPDRSPPQLYNWIKGFHVLCGKEPSLTLSSSFSQSRATKLSEFLFLARCDGAQTRLVPIHARGYRFPCLSHYHSVWAKSEWLWCSAAQSVTSARADSFGAILVLQTELTRRLQLVFSIFPLSTHFTAAFLAVWLSLFFGPQTLVSRLHLLRLPFYNGAGRKNDMEKLLGYYRLGFNRHTVQFWVHTERKVAKI